MRGSADVVQSHCVLQGTRTDTDFNTNKADDFKKILFLKQSVHILIQVMGTLAKKQINTIKEIRRPKCLIDCMHVTSSSLSCAGIPTEWQKNKWKSPT